MWKIQKKELDIVAVELRDIGLQIGVNIHCQREEIFGKNAQSVRRTAMIKFLRSSRNKPDDRRRKSGCKNNHIGYQSDGLY